MEQNNYEALRKVFFKSYKSFVDFIMLSQSEYGMYTILVLKKNTYCNLSKVHIVIRNSHNGDGMCNEYSNNVVLNNEEAECLINDIRNDFKNNHYITYSSVNPRTCIQTLQNTRFSLNIRLTDEHEFEDAVKFNDKINSSKQKILQRK